MERNRPHWGQPWTVAMLVAAACLAGCKDDDSGAGGSGSGVQEEIKDLPPASLATTADAQTGLQAYNNGLSGYSSLTSNLIVTALIYLPSSESLGLSGVQSAPGRPATPARWPLTPRPQTTAQTSTPCPAVKSSGNYQTENGTIKGSLDATVDFGENGCTPQGSKARLLGKIEVDLDSDGTEGAWSFDYTGFKFFDEQARLIGAADGTIEITWKGSPSPLTINTTAGVLRPTETLTTIQVKGFDEGRELQVEGTSTFRQITNVLLESAEDLKVTESGITHYLSRSTFLELLEGTPQPSAVGGAPTETQTYKFKIDQRLEYGSAVFGRFQLQSSGVVVSSACGQNPISGTTVVSNEKANITVTYHEACDGKADLAINGSPSGQVDAVSLQSVTP